MERERGVSRECEVPGPREQEYLEQALALRADSLLGPLLVDQVKSRQGRSHHKEAELGKMYQLFLEQVGDGPQGLFPS